MSAVTLEQNPQQYPASDEIDLIELAGKLWEQKWLIAGVTAFCTLLAVAYALLSTPVYQATATVSPPLSADIAPLNESRIQAKLPALTVDEVYALFKRNLTSRSSYLWFFRDYYRPYREEQGTLAPRDAMLKSLDKLMQVSQPDQRNNPSIYTVSITLPGEPELAADWATRYLELVAERTMSDIAANTEKEVANRIAAIDRNIADLREAARIRREDRIARLQEALVVAEAVGYESPQVVAGRTSGESELLQMIDGSLMYMRGAKAIRSELKLLSERENDDPFIGALRDLQIDRGLLTTVNSRPENVQLYRLDSPAEVPDTPIKPKKALIVALGLVVGGMLGGMLVLIRIAVRNRKHNQ